MMGPDSTPADGPAKADSVSEDPAVRPLLVPLDRSSRASLRRQLEASLRAAIRDGRLRAGTRMASSRDLARQLGVSRGVVVDAYDALAAQGFLQTRNRAAPLVAAQPQSISGGTRNPPSRPARPRFDLTATTPDVSLFDRAAWGRAVQHALREAPDAALDYGDPNGVPELRHGLADYLGRVRAVATTPEYLTVVQGFTQAIDLAFRVLSASGARTVAFEDPSHDEQWEAARRAGLTPVPVPVDAHGIRVHELTRADPDAVVVTPAHQFPTGVLLAPSRRRALLAWADRRSALVIEDDYDSEFRYDRAPVGTLQGLSPGHVLYIGTASKTLAPTLRLGWAVVPPHLADRYTQAKRYADAGSPMLEQLALARLLATGSYERAVHKARTAYRRRRDALVAALADELPECTVEGIAAGMHVVLRLPSHRDETDVVAAAATRGLRLRPLGDFRMTPHASPGPALLLGYSRLPASAVPQAVRELAAAVRCGGCA